MRAHFCRVENDEEDECANEEEKRMRKYWLSIALVIMAVLASAFAFSLKNQGSATRPLEVNNPATHPASSPPVSIPKTNSWLLAKDPSASKTGLVLAVHLVAINTTQTIILYSLETSDQISSTDLQLSLIEDGKTSVRVKENTLLGQFGNVQFGVLKAAPPTAKGAELTLTVDSPQTGPFEVNVTRSTDASYNELPPDFSDISIAARESSIQEGDYIISFNGFGLYTGDLQADRNNAQSQSQAQDLETAQIGTKSSEPQPARTMAQPVPLTQELAAGNSIWDHVTLRIQNLATKEVKFLYVVMLGDGEVKSRILE